MKVIPAIPTLFLALCPYAGHAQSLSSDEDWSSISIPHGSLRAVPPMVAERDEYPTFVREMIELRWRPGDPIHLFLILPKLQAKPPVIVYLYGYPSETDRFMDDDFCKLLAEKGFAAAGFVSALTGQRYHRAFKEWFVSELQESIGSSVHDVQMILNYLSGRGDVDTTRAGMFGEGSGGAIAILAAAADPRIQALDLLDPWGDWPDWLARSGAVPDDERAAYLKPEFLKAVAPLDPLAWIGKLKIPIRLQYLTEPVVTPQVVRDRLAAAAPPQTKMIPHKEALAEYKAASIKFFDWIKEQLQPEKAGSKSKA
jgi:cephalosporin-C deacetylase-like acetyl esterase